MAQSYKELVAWQKAIDLVVAIYKLTEGFPKHELYGLTSQLRRAAVSVPSNIAEGQARYSKREFVHFLRNSLGSLAEIETQLVICERLKYIDAEQLKRSEKQSAEIGRITNGLINSMQVEGA
ncbi:MAG: four helix bundle protein [Acidobacteriota bacterium]|nr:four helix bundle protein [Acidobacteriota bacterium]